MMPICRVLWLPSAKHPLKIKARIKTGVNTGALRVLLNERLLVLTTTVKKHVHRHKSYLMKGC